MAEMSRAAVLEFLKALEVAIPPNPKCHHALMAMQYGSDAAGWEDRLALQVSGVTDGFVTLFLDDFDWTLEPQALVASVVDVIAVMAHPELDWREIMWWRNLLKR